MMSIARTRWGAVVSLFRNRRSHVAGEPPWSDGDPLHAAHLEQVAATLPGPDYYEVLEWIHDLVRPTSYVEIGVQRAKSLTLARPPTVCIGIDPAPDVRFELTAPTRIFEETSDDFFRDHDLRQLLGRPHFSLAFIDGLHLFEQTLRDFIHLERFAGPDSVIAIHDCLPLNRATSERKRRTKLWSGDVWKVALCLAKYRPDLKLVTVRAGPTGLSVVTRLDPRSTLLDDHYSKILKELKPLDFDFFRDHAELLPRTIGNAREEFAAWLASGRDG